MNSAQRTLVLIPAAVIAAGVATWSAMRPAELHSAGPAYLLGWVDLHTHPMVNLAFGGKLIYGGVDVGSLLPADQHCNHNVRATSWQQALSDDRSTARGYNMFENGCGDNIREQVLWALQDANHALHTPTNARGADDFASWPAWNDITHQKMWVDWIHRAYEGGERVLVALAVNNKTLGDATAGPGDYATDDKTSADLQIEETKAFIGRHGDFMEVAYTPADLQRIVSSNKLAVVLGIEVDNLGNFNSGPAPSEAAVQAEISRLRGEGVRYIFPIHVLDNVFGGTAVYEGGFDLSNYREAGHFWDLTCSNAGEQITFKFKPEGFDVAVALVKATKLNVDIARNPPDPPTCPAGTGHVNTRGLTPLGEFAINEMMKQGMIVDIDHMSRLSADRALTLAEAVPGGGYPIVSGHTGIRGFNGANAENSRTALQLHRIGALHGMFGLGTAHHNAYTWIHLYNSAMGLLHTPGAIQFGTDLNGLVVAPGPRSGSHIVYDGSFPRSALGTRQWDYNRDGVAHYGLLAEFVRDMRTAPSGGPMVDDYLMHGAQYFYEMWQRIENQKGRVGTTGVPIAERTPVAVKMAGDTTPSNARAPAPVKGAVMVNAPPGETPHPGAAPGAAAAPAAAPAPGAAMASPARVTAPVMAAPAAVTARPAAPARAGAQLKLRVAQGLGTVKGTYWVTVTAVDSATGVIHAGTITINNVKGATGQKITFKECYSNGVATKCTGTVTVTNYPDATFTAGG